MPELRAELPDYIAAVLDGYCSASGQCRTKVVVDILDEWAKQKHHESIVILRVAGNNPIGLDKKN